MLVGVDWGSTKIEAIAIADDGQPIARLREATPRSDYEGCLATVAAVVSSVEAMDGATGSVGIGIPGSLDPRTGIAKGASSTWLNRRPEQQRRRMGPQSAPRARHRRSPGAFLLLRPERMPRALGLGLVLCARLPSARQHRFGHLRAPWTG
jgi:ROK family